MYNKNFPGDPLELDEVPGADEENKSHFTLTSPWNLGSLASNYPGIIVRQHHTDHKQMGLLKEQFAERREETSAVLSPSGLDNGWWTDFMECCRFGIPCN